MSVALGWVKVVAVALLLAEAGARPGLALLGWLGARLRRPLERAALGLLVGMVGFGTAMLGVACAGVFFPPVIVAVAVGLLAASWRVAPRSSVLAETWAGARAAGLPAALGIAATLLPAAFALLTAETEHDSFLYHLGVPWQFLQFHAAQVDNVSWTFHYPLPIDLSFVVPILLGDDRLAKWMVAGCWLAANAVWLDRAARRGGGRLTWLGAWLMLGGISTFWLLTRTKNDLPAAALIVAGMLVHAEGRGLLGALLLGAGAAAKLTYLPLAVVWLALTDRPWRDRIAGLVCLGFAPLPWFAKSWLVTGDPLFPFAWRWFPTFNWGPANDAIMRLFLGETGHTGLLATLKGLPGVLWSAWKVDYPQASLALVALLWRPRARRVLGVLAAAQALTMVGHGTSRYLLPSVWFACLAAAGELEALRGRWKTVAIGAFAAAAVYRVGVRYHEAGIVWSEILLPADGFRDVHMRSYEQSIAMLRKYQVARVLSAGERLTYRLPARVLYTGEIGETPLVWKCVTETRTRERLEVRFRQIGARWLLYNFISASWLSTRYGSFPWDVPMLRRYLLFCREHLEAADMTENNDFFTGASYLYRLRRDRLNPPPVTVLFLPGTEAIYQQSLILANMNRFPDLLKESLRLFKIIPEVGHSWNQVGHAYALLRDIEHAFPFLLKFTVAGMMDETNIPELGIAAARKRQVDLADWALGISVKRYVNQKSVILLNMGYARTIRAENALMKGKPADAMKLLEEGEAIVRSADVAHEAPEQAEFQRTTLAAIAADKGVACEIAGQKALAGQYFREAVSIAPELPMAAKWKAEADKLPQTLGF